jgi:type I restriction enzyme M protein
MCMLNMIADHTCESRTHAAKTKEIEDAVYDLKAVNPNKKADTDDCTPEDLLDIIETKGMEIAEVLSRLKNVSFQ